MPRVPRMPRVLERITPLGVERKVTRGWSVIAVYHQRGRRTVQLHTPRKRIKTYRLED